MRTEEITPDAAVFRREPQRTPSMSATEPRLIWIHTAHGMLDVYVAECGRYDFEIRTTPHMGHQLRMWEIRPEDSPLLLWECDGYSLSEAKARAERLANRHMPAMVR
jgi:hypothetical protein